MTILQNYYCYNYILISFASSLNFKKYWVFDLHCDYMYIRI